MAGAAISAVFGIFSAMGQMNAAKDQAEAQKKELKARQAQANVQAKNQRRAAYREAMLAQARGEAAVVQAGASQGSSAYGGAQAQGTIGKGNVQTIHANMSSQQQISKFQGQQADAQGEIAKWQGIASIGSSIGGLVGAVAG